MIMKVKTADLSDLALDWAVAKCEGCSEKRLLDVAMWSYMRQQGAFRYSTDWSQGGPIIERETMNLWRYNNHTKPYFAEKRHFGRHHKAGRSYGEGPTILVAAMRCFVASKLGDEIEIPEELLK